LYKVDREEGEGLGGGPGEKKHAFWFIDFQMEFYGFPAILQRDLRKIRNWFLIFAYAFPNFFKILEMHIWFSNRIFMKFADECSIFI
jgi:hypothetical protein